MELHASELGTGLPVCLLHGLFGRSQNLAGLARRLASRFRVISLDLRNHGASPHAAGMDYASLAVDVLETLGRRSALPACLLGHSMGGKVAMMAALTQPSFVSRLIVGDIAPVRYDHRNADVAQALTGLCLIPGLARPEADRALATTVRDPAIRGFLLQNLITGTAPAWRIGLDEIAAGLPDIEGWPDVSTGLRYVGPTLFVAGDRSDYVTPSALPAIEALFPRAALVRLAGAGHWLHADQPDGFARVVEDFLSADGGAEKNPAATAVDAG